MVEICVPSTKICFFLYSFLKMILYVIIDFILELTFTEC